MKNLNRRRFLRQGFAGAAGIALAPSFLSSAKSSDENILYRTLGKTGLKVPVISFGVMRSDNPGLCKAAYEKGIKLFDTAHGYQNGNNEIMLGNLFKAYPRDSFYLATKVKAAGISRDGKPSSETTPEEFLSSFDVSLSRLQMEYVDILYLHDVSNPELLKYAPIVSALKNLKKEGKIRFMGFSTHRNEPAVIDAAASMNDWEVILTAYNFQQSYRKELDEAIKKAANSGIGIVAMKTLAGGGFLDKERTKPINTTAAIKWALSNPDIHTTIPGMTNFDQLDLNLKILSDVILTQQEKNDILVACAQPGLFCPGCNECLKACPKNLPVPDIMRAYMYSYGYSDPSKAYSLLCDLGVESDPCNNCEVDCRGKCSRKFNIREKITDISRLINVPPGFLA